MQLTRCVFCHKAFSANDRFAHAPLARRLAFDPERGRLWAICDRCDRWTLWPVEDRHAALHELERAARDTGTVVARTENISLLEVDGLLLVRVGRAGLLEEASWRYGRELRRRKRAFEGPASRLTAFAFGAVHLVSEAVGLADPDVDITWDDTPVADILRWRRFGYAAWRGRIDCPYCGSTLCALRYDMSWWCYPVRYDGEGLGLGVPCQRCDPWTPDNLHVIGGPEAENVLRRCLAYQNIGGAEARVLREAAGAIEEAGSPDAFAQESAARRDCLWKMGPTGAIALEIAVGESVERRLLDLDAHSVEFRWRREEELARIIDEELTPRPLLERHLRKLPIRLGARPSAPLQGTPSSSPSIGSSRAPFASHTANMDSPVP